MTCAVLLLVTSPGMTHSPDAEESGGQKQPSSLSPKSKTPQPWDFMAVPLVNFTSDRGLGYGAFGAVFHRGAAASEKTPYSLSVGGQFYQTTGGYAFHKLLLDFPNIGGTGLRADLTSGYESWDSAWYFGLGNNRPRLRVNETPERFYESELDSLWAVPNLRIPLSEPWQLFAGVIFRSTAVNAYPDSLLAIDQPPGIEGGCLLMGSIGLMIDTRDQEPTPSRGLWSELSVRGGHRSLGSDWTSGGLNATHRHWIPVDEKGKVIFAYRVGFDAHGEDMPFFQQHILGGSQWVDLGGNIALRGLPNGRYRGYRVIYGSFEARWLTGTARFDATQLDLLVVPFIDWGRVWTPNESDALLHMHGAAGLGVRVIYNQLFVARLDAGFGLEEFRQPDQNRTDNVIDRAPVLGVYVIVGHSF